MSMFSYQRLIKKLLQPTTGQTIARMEEIDIERIGGVKEIPCRYQRRKTPATSLNLTSRPHPYNDTQTK